MWYAPLGITKRVTRLRRGDYYDVFSRFMEMRGFLCYLFGYKHEIIIERQNDPIISNFSGNNMS